MYIFAHLGAPPKQTCPKSVVAGDLDTPAPLPGVDAGDDPEKPSEIKPVEQYTVTKVIVGGLVGYGLLKVLGWL